MYETILVPIDLTEVSEGIIKRAVEFASSDTTVLLVYIYETAYLEGSYETYLYTGIDNSSHLIDKERLADLVNYAKKLGASKVNSEIISSTSVAGCINYEVEEDYDIDLIVIGASHRTGLTKFVSGNIPSSVVRHAKCDVFVVR